MAEITDAAWQALITRAPWPEFYAVRTTKIFCRHGCPARTPLRKNIEVFQTVEQAQAAGYRACLRCKPAQPL